MSSVGQTWTKTVRVIINLVASDQQMGILSDVSPDGITCQQIDDPVFNMRKLTILIVRNMKIYERMSEPSLIAQLDMRVEEASKIIPAFTTRS